MSYLAHLVIKVAFPTNKMLEKLKGETKFGVNFKAVFLKIELINIIFAIWIFCVNMLTYHQWVFGLLRRTDNCEKYNVL